MPSASNSPAFSALISPANIGSKGPPKRTDPRRNLSDKSGLFARSGLDNVLNFAIAIAAQRLARRKTAIVFLLDDLKPGLNTNLRRAYAAFHYRVMNPFNCGPVSNCSRY